MAQKLNTEYGFSYDNLKVLLGGWNGWKEANSINPAAYPISTGPNPNLRAMKLQDPCMASPASK